MAKTGFRLKKEMFLTVPASPGPCAAYAQEELIRLLAKLGTSVRIVKGKSRCMFLLNGSLEAPPEKNREPIPEIRGNGYLHTITEKAVRMDAKTEKGLLNAVYALAENLGITFLLPGDENEILDENAPLPLKTGCTVRNMRCEHAGIACETGVVTKDDYPGQEWMRFFAKLRFDMVFRHAGGHIRNEPRFGFLYGDGKHEFHHLLSQEFKEKHPETCRQIQPDDFGSVRANDYNFCPSSETAWREIEKNLLAQRDAYKDLDHIALEQADLPGGGRCFCSSCRSYSAADLQALIMNRFAEIFRKMGLKTTIQMNAYHDTMTPSRLFPPHPQVRPHFCPRERCWSHALNDPDCARNRGYMESLKQWDRSVFSFNRNATYVGYYNDQILFRGLYPFLPHTMLRDFDCMLQNGIRNFMSLQTGGQVFQPDYNLLLHAEMVWNDHLTAADFIRSLAAKVAGKKYARVLSDYLIRRMRVYEKAMIWCELDADICHLDYRWLKEDSSPFFRRLVRVYGNAEKKLRCAASKLDDAIRGMPSGLPLADLLRKESSRTVFEAEVFHVMKLQQEVFSDLPEARRTRDAGKVRACRQKLVKLLKALADSVKTGEAAGQREAYYGKFADPWMRQDLNRKIAWCDSILKKQPVQGFEK